MPLKKTIRLIILVSVCYSALSIVLLHFLQPDKDPMVNAISEYVDGNFGNLMTSVFFVQSLGSFALAMLVLYIRPRARKITIGGTLFIMAAVGDVVAGLFQADPINVETMSSTGVIHTVGGLVRFLALAVGLPLLSSVLKKIEPWKEWGSQLKTLAIIFVIAFVITLFVLAPMGLFGLGQRVFIATVLAWMFMIGLPKEEPK